MESFRATDSETACAVVCKLWLMSYNVYFAEYAKEIQKNSQDTITSLTANCIN